MRINRSPSNQTPNSEIIWVKSGTSESHLSKGFNPNPILPPSNVLDKVNQVLEQPIQFNTPLKIA